MVINSNITALAASRQLSKTSRLLAKALGRLSSGSRITSAEDDPGGLAAAINFTTTNHRNLKVLSNLENAISFSQTQSGILRTAQKTLDRLSALTILAQDSTKTDADRANYDSEFQALKDSLDASFQTTFNGINLFEAAPGAAATQSGFDGLYAPGSWTFSSNPPGGANSGSVNTALAPGSITLTGVDGPFAGPPLGASDTDYTITAVASGTVTFDWNYSGLDANPKDEGYYLLNGAPTFLANNSGGSGTISFAVNAGDTFGFRVHSTDSKKEAGVLAVSNFSAPLSSSSGGARAVTVDNDASLLTLENIAPISISGSVGTISAASSALSELKTAIESLSAKHAIVGATLSVLQLHHDTVSVLVENLHAAASLLMDTDYALESTRFAKQLMLSQAGVAMLGQANVQSEIALKLLPA